MNERMTAAEYRRDILGEPVNAPGQPMPDACRGCIPGSIADVYRWRDETEFQTWIIAVAKEHGWLAYHPHDPRKSAAGFPDLVIARVGEAPIFLELKTMIGAASEDQVAWLRATRGTLVRPIHAEWVEWRLKGGPMPVRVVSP